MRELLRELEPVKAGDDILDVCRASRMNAMMEAIKRLAAGANLEVSGGIYKSATEGSVSIYGRKQEASGGALEALWDIQPQADPKTNSREGFKLVNPGTVRKTSALDSGVEIEHLKDFFPVEEAGYLYLKVELNEENDVVASLAFGEIPCSPELWEVQQVSAGYAEFTAHYYPLWRFHSADDEDDPDFGASGVKVGDFVGIKYAAPSHFQMFNIRWEEPATGNVCSVIQLMESYRGYIAPVI